MNVDKNDGKLTNHYDLYKSVAHFKGDFTCMNIKCSSVLNYLKAQ